MKNLLPIFLFLLPLTAFSKEDCSLNNCADVGVVFDYCLHNDGSGDGLFYFNVQPGNFPIPNSGYYEVDAYLNGIFFGTVQIESPNEWIAFHTSLNIGDEWCMSIAGCTASYNLDCKTITPFEECPKTTYCIPQYSYYTTPLGNYIESVGIGSFTNTNTGAPNDHPSYQDYTSTSINVEAGNTYDFLIQTALSSSVNTQYGIWIDLNDDGHFNDAEELIYYGTSNINGDVIGIQYEIPDIIGERRVRFRSGLINPSFDACIVNSCGETEDYTLVITSNAVPCGHEEVLDVYNTMNDFGSCTDPICLNFDLYFPTYNSTSTSFWLEDINGNYIMPVFPTVLGNGSLRFGMLGDLNNPIQIPAAYSAGFLVAQIVDNTTGCTELVKEPYAVIENLGINQITLTDVLNDFGPCNDQICLNLQVHFPNYSNTVTSWWLEDNNGNFIMNVTPNEFSSGHIGFGLAYATSPILVNQLLADGVLVALVQDMSTGCTEVIKTNYSLDEPIGNVEEINFSHSNICSHFEFFPSIITSDGLPFTNTINWYAEGVVIGSSTGDNPFSYTFNTTGIVQICAEETLCGLTYCENISIPDMVTSITPDTSILLGQSVPLQATGGTNYIWSPVDGLSNATIPNPIAIPSETTTYTVVIMDDNGCSTTESITITVTDTTCNFQDEIIVAEVFNDFGPCDDFICLNFEATFTNHPNVTTNWSIQLMDGTLMPLTPFDLGGGILGFGIGYGGSPIMLDHSNNYVELIAEITDENGCTDTVTTGINIPIDNINGIYFTYTSSSCLEYEFIGEVMTDSGNPAWSEIEWTVDGITIGTSLATEIFNYSFSSAGTYNVCANDILCGISYCEQIDINPSTLSTTISQDTTIFIGSTVTLSATGGTSYLWSPTESLDNPTIASPLASPNTTTTYTVTITDDNGCTQNEQVTIDVVEPGGDCIGQEGNMTIIATLCLNGIPVTESTDSIFIFVNGQPRGGIELKNFSSFSSAYAFLMPCGNTEENGTTINFVYKNVSTQSYYIVHETLIFNINDSHGTILNPLKLNAGLTTTTIPLNSGWNWRAFNLISQDMSINTVLSSMSPSNGDILKSQAGGFVQYFEGLGWIGSIDSINVEDMYMINTTNPDSIIITGTPADPTTETNLVDGWSWINPCYQVPLPINTVLSSLSTVSSGDLIKSQNDGFAQYFDGFYWIGSLEEFIPNKGYMLKLGNPATMRINDGGCMTSGQNNMTFIAKIVDADNVPINCNSCKVKAIIDGVCHSEMSDYIDLSGNNLLWDQVFTDNPGTDQGKEISFVYIDGDKEYEIREMYNFNLDGMGSPIDPIILTLNEVITPVELMSFTAHLNPRNETVLNWSTATERHNSHFNVERKVNDNRWETIRKIIGKGTTSEMQKYSFIDTNPKRGTNYYRLKQVDFDGQFEYSYITEVTLQSSGKSIEIFPIPFKEQFYINLDINTGSTVKLRLLTTDGKVAHRIDNLVYAPNMNIDLGESNLNSGLYILDVQTEHSTFTKKIILEK